LIARIILAGDAQATLVPNESIFELRLLVRHRWRMIRVHGVVLRYAIGLLDRVLSEYDANGIISEGSYVLLHFQDVKNSRESNA